MQRIDFSENQIGVLVESVEDVLHKMEEAQDISKDRLRTTRLQPESVAGSSVASERTRSSLPYQRGRIAQNTGSGRRK